MAVYFLHVKIFSRANGSRVTKAAAYRSGEKIRDERTSESYNHSRRNDVTHKEIVLPSDLAEHEGLEWARDRSTLWNAAEHAGKLRNSRLAREVLVILPPELQAAQRTALVQRFSQELADKYRNAVDLSVHEPREGSDERHHHAHLLMTTRQVTAAGMGARTTLELSGTERHALGLGPSKEDLVWTRERWATVTNEALRDAGLSTRIDHRSYQAQGLDQEPQPVMPQAIYYQERLSGVASPAGDAIRARHQERVAAREQGGDELAAVLERQREAGRARALERARQREAAPKPAARGSMTREQLNARRVEHERPRREHINRLQRERRHAKTRAAEAEKLLTSPTPATRAEQSVANWRAYRARASTQPTQPAAERWREMRARGVADAASTATPGESRGDASTASDHESRSRGPRDRDNDAGL